jgi:transposase InsO family protein
VVQIAFALDCHDREAMAHVAQGRVLQGSDIRQLMSAAVESRFGHQSPAQAVQWLSDNGGIYTALETVLEAELLGLEPITTPAYSPRSNGMSEAFVNTLKRDYANGAMLWDAPSVLQQVPGWFADYNQRAPPAGTALRTGHVIAPAIPRNSRISATATELKRVSLTVHSNWGAKQV